MCLDVKIVSFINYFYEAIKTVFPDSIIDICINEKFLNNGFIRFRIAENDRGFSKAISKGSIRLSNDAAEAARIEAENMIKKIYEYSNKFSQN